MLGFVSRCWKTLREGAVVPASAALQLSSACLVMVFSGKSLVRHLLLNSLPWHPKGNSFQQVLEGGFVTSSTGLELRL